LVLFFKKEPLPFPPAQQRVVTPILLPALAALSAAVTVIMIRIGTLDHPVARSSHTRPTPKGGGVGIAAATLAGMAVAPGFAGVDAVLPAAALCLAAVSYVDDVRDLPFWVKMAAQGMAALVLVAAGGAVHRIAIPGLGTIALGWLGPLLSFLWLIFVTNAVNFMDGVNGLASGSAAVACLGVAAVAGLQASWPEAVLIAGVLGFLPFNYPAARLFMGDVGSQFLGFMLAGLALRHAADPLLAFILPLALLPMLADVGLTLIRRWRRAERLTQAHRSHVYQIANRTGIPAWIVTLIYWMLASIGAAAGGMSARAAGGLLGIALAAILPFLAWVFYVEHRAQRQKPTTQ
jgi:UDP-GlcNAc:undecaprenyl-phosphate/decaprenyl-phosphate GlcNAc-1-phosphate transferase